MSKRLNPKSPKYGANKYMITKDELENNLNRVHEWIRAADNKVSILLALEGIVITLLLSDSLASYAKSFQYNCWNIVFIIASLVLLFISAYKAVLAIIPRLSRKRKKLSLFYFGDVAEMDLKEYKKAIKELDESEYVEQVIEQIHTSSIIATSKHQHFRNSIIALSLSFLLLVASWALQFLPLWLIKTI